MQKAGMATTTQALHNQHTATALTGMRVLMTSCLQFWQHIDSVTNFLQHQLLMMLAMCSVKKPGN